MIPTFVLPSLRDSKQKKINYISMPENTSPKFQPNLIMEQTNAKLRIHTQDSRRYFSCCGLDGLETSCTAPTEWFVLFQYSSKSNTYNNSTSQSKICI